MLYANTEHGSQQQEWIVDANQNHDRSNNGTPQPRKRMLSNQQFEFLPFDTLSW